MANLGFNLLENAKDSLRQTVHLLTTDDAIPSNIYKQAILSIVHCSELLLKERLKRINPAFIWDNIDKYPSLATRTVTIEKAISRLVAIGNVTIKKRDKETLLACIKIRNAIQHYEFSIQEKEAKILLGKALSFVFSFGTTELHVDLDEDFKDDDTWEMLLKDFYEFASEHGTRISELMMGGPVGFCLHCEEETVDLIFDRCNLCGKSYDQDEFDEAFAENK